MSKKNEIECHACESPMHRDVRPMEYTFKGEKKVVEQPGWYCTKCDESILDGKDLAATKKTLDEFRAQVKGILAPHQIRAIRDSLGYTQTEASEKLGGGPNAFYKYEKGLVSPPKSTCIVLQQLLKNPKLLDPPPQPFDIPPEEIGDWFLWRHAKDNDPGDQISQLKLQKLVYFAQVEALVSCERPLFREDFQAWTHGPVLLSLRIRFKEYGTKGLPAPKRAPILPQEVENILLRVDEKFGGYTPAKLRQLSHLKPWKDARKNLPEDAPSDSIITKESMLVFGQALNQL